MDAQIRQAMEIANRPRLIAERNARAAEYSASCQHYELETETELWLCRLAVFGCTAILFLQALLVR